MRLRYSAALAFALLAALGAAASAPAQTPAMPIPGPLEGPLTVFAGSPATAHPIGGPVLAPNPTLAPDGRSGSGLAAGNGGASPYPGPLGHDTTSTSAVQFGTCDSLALDKDDRLLTLCSGPLGPALRLVDPVSLATIATLPLPPRPNPNREDLAGGTHFIVRANGSLLMPTNAGELVTIAVAEEALRIKRSIDLGDQLAGGERPVAVAAGYDGIDWVTGTEGTVIAVPRRGGEMSSLNLHEPIAEDLATDKTGTYVVTDEALYRIEAGIGGEPRVIWRQPILSGLADSRSGKVHPGSGTPPVILPRGYVAVADGLNPPRVIVVRIDGPSRRRLACAVPVFTPGKGSVEAHLVSANRSIVVTNAYGYTGLGSTEGGNTTVGGIARIVVGRRGCRTAWTSEEISPSAQPVLSRATGLLYTQVKPKSFPDAWNLAAIDWRTGRTRFAALSGEGLGYNSENGAVILGPSGSAYAGTFGGVVRFSDG